MRKVGNLFLTKDGSFSDGEREFFNVGREFLYTSCGPAAHAFLPLRSIQAHTASAGQAGFASHKPLRFRPIGLQTPPVLLCISSANEIKDFGRHLWVAVSPNRSPAKRERQSGGLPLFYIQLRQLCCRKWIPNADLERRSPAALSKNQHAPKAIAGSEPCAGCSDDVASPFRLRPPSKV